MFQLLWLRRKCRAERCGTLVSGKLRLKFLGEVILIGRSGRTRLRRLPPLAHCSSLTILTIFSAKQLEEKVNLKKL